MDPDPQRRGRRTLILPSIHVLHPHQKDKGQTLRVISRHTAQSGGPSASTAQLLTCWPPSPGAHTRASAWQGQCPRMSNLTQTSCMAVLNSAKAVSGEGRWSLVVSVDRRASPSSRAWDWAKPHPDRKPLFPETHPLHTPPLQDGSPWLETNWVSVRELAVCPASWGHSSTDSS